MNIGFHRKPSLMGYVFTGLQVLGAVTLHAHPTRAGARWWHRVRSLLVACALTLGLGLAGPANAGLRVVGYAQDAADNEWRVAQARELAEAFAKLPNIEFIISRGGGNIAKQIADVEAFTQRRVDLLIVSPRDTVLLAEPIARAHRAGIPVILISRRVNGEEFTTHVGPDDEDIGRLAARLIARRLDGRGDVLMFKGTPTTSTAIARTHGFVEELRHHPGLRLVDTRTANYQRSEAIREMEDVLRSGTPFSAIYAQNDTMASGVRLALKQAGRDLHKLVLVGVDYLPEAREAIRAGEQTASFIYPTCVPEVVRAAQTILAGAKVPRRIVVPATLVERDNVERHPSAF
jgi:ribose transport system substrate-binding protein